MVDPVDRISSSAATTATQIGTSLSIESEADNAWVAARQSRMTADLLALAAEAHNEAPHPHPAEDHEPGGVQEDGHAPSRQFFEPEGDAPAAEPEPEATLSGESERIGSVNFDDDTPFGHREAIV
ncbi:hypothetical protein HGO38_06100 [Rhizobium sp. CG5]|uniref:hypothetical protein n=1 Tax=Rhizobium sp. CG5 TaxID=2726076 RepID=UPI002034859C|nr:hypothetical protein [Rhizobium sp. CG5]MCM2473048.1 hypothetical protein [Rhizobium sp. CG5]